MPRITTHPGEILREEYLTPLRLSARKLAEEIDVVHNRISEIIKGNRAITADTAQRLAIRFDTTPQFWMNLQSNYELSLAASENDYSSLKQREFA